MSGMDEPRKPSPPDRMSAIKDPWSYRDTDGIPRKPVSTNRYSNKAIIYADAAVILIPPLFGILGLGFRKAMKGRREGEPLATLAAALCIVGTVIGMILGYVATQHVMAAPISH